MNNASSEKITDSMPNPQDLPPPYSEAVQPPVQPPAPIAVQPMPSHLYYVAAFQDPKEVPILQPVPFTPASDYLVYSIFTMLCCCLPLGVAALVYSIQTREANHEENSTTAQRSSRMARILAHSALGVGIGVIILYVIFRLFAYSVLK
ncbi:synapse differentiation-inducing gene protein 1-like [Notechis scutatus]|uniref:Synapse differentiation-inducing gene protein 1-like n=1 Tax=Notechis scutatus TaxID=8663 RepID=A0A6J1VM18_9SAUR|nr:synapse differentiation-inducing gene protein 1-like [Notechis scutatus]